MRYLNGLGSGRFDAVARSPPAQAPAAVRRRREFVEATQLFGACDGQHIVIQPLLAAVPFLIIAT